MSIDFVIRAPRGEARARKALAEALREEYPRLEPNGSSGSNFLFEGMEVDLHYGGSPANESMCDRISCHLHGSQTPREQKRCLRFLERVATELGWTTSS